MFDEPRLTSIAHFVTSTSSMQKEDLTIRVLVTNVSHLYETEIVGDLTIEKTTVAYVAYKEENGQLVPEVKFED